ncbi:MAG TPA: hypothetical protein VME42_15100 [Steroidobacteraceae bacterium]|nr:hypothetical protein [Steroidobacteraceae bacterium]
MSLKRIILGGVATLALLCACAVSGPYGYGYGVDYEGGFYEPYGYDYGGWGPDFYVGPPGGGHWHGRGHWHGGGYGHGGGGHGGGRRAPSIPGRRR